MFSFQGELLSPCRCDGSVKCTHQPCLIKWISERGCWSCELCYYKYHVIAISTKNPLQVKVLEIIPKSFPFLVFAFPCFLYLHCWLCVCGFSLYGALCVVKKRTIHFSYFLENTSRWPGGKINGDLEIKYLAKQTLKFSSTRLPTMALIRGHIVHSKNLFRSC